VLSFLFGCFIKRQGNRRRDEMKEAHKRMEKMNSQMSDKILTKTNKLSSLKI
jgi:hypothetical protein